MTAAAITNFRPAFAEVALPIPLRKTFTYRLSLEQAEKTAIGSRVVVPFGKRILTGYVTDLRDKPDPELSIDETQIRDVVEVSDDEPLLLTPEVLELARWIADYYLMPLGEVLKAALPTGIDPTAEEVISLNDEAGVRTSVRSAVAKAILDHLANAGPAALNDLAKEFGREDAKKAIASLAKSGLVERSRRIVGAKVKPKTRKAVRLIQNGAEGLSAQQAAIIETVAAADGEMFFTDLLEAAKVGASPVNTLAKKGIVEIFVAESLRDPIAEGTVSPWRSVTLNAEQAAALDAIGADVVGGQYAAFLLKGVTGSGKTEVYLRAMSLVLQQGRSAMMLVPEIALTPIFSRRLRQLFGRGVAILHSNLSAGARFDEWRRIRTGDARIVIGTRSAIFAPIQNLGLLIVDEEHDSSYRQSDLPFYNARDAAVVAASQRDAVVVLGSATPSLESYRNAKAGKYHLLELPRRIEDRPLAAVRLIDMREEFKRAGGRDVLLSNELTNAIRETHARGEQSIILLNRRGYSSFVMCRSCGEKLRCRNCDVTLTYHKGQRRLLCHYCGFTADTPKVCPFCESEYLYFIGEGTEKVEEHLAARFPDLRIERVDRDTMKRKGQIERILLAFDRGEIDMLVGTQMLAKGHDFQNVTLVGVVSVDIGLGLPDFRSAERTFQILTQVAGRAGRGPVPGSVFVQTYYPDHYALQFAVEQDFDGFYAREITFRERMGYPPAVSLALIKIASRDAAAAQKTARIIRTALDKMGRGGDARILGPAPSPLSKLKGDHRMQLIVRAPSRKAIRELLDPALEFAETAGADLRPVSVEIDPVNLM